MEQTSRRPCSDFSLIANAYELCSVIEKQQALVLSTRYAIILQYPQNGSTSKRDQIACTMRDYTSEKSKKASDFVLSYRRICQYWQIIYNSCEDSSLPLLRPNILVARETFLV